MAGIWDAREGARKGHQMTETVKNWTRRTTMAGLAAGTGVTIAGLDWTPAAAEPIPETDRIRIAHFENDPVLCWAPQYLVQDLLRLEGFNEIELVPIREGQSNADLLEMDLADLSLPLAYDAAVDLDNGAPLTVIGGLHIGCVEVFANKNVESLSDLKGSRLLIEHKNFDAYRFLSSVLTWVGLDPETDVEWIAEPDRFKWAELFRRGDVDVMRAFTPVNYDIREMGLGHVILNTTLDDPWKNYYCCMIAVRSQFARKFPAATKRILRAFAKAQDQCASDRTWAAGKLVEMGATNRADYAERALQDIPYGAWRYYDPQATLLFFALRMHEAGMIKSTPLEIVERGSDFRFLEALRRELKT